MFIAALHLAPPEVARGVGEYYYAAVATCAIACCAARNETVRLFFQMVHSFLLYLLSIRSRLFTLVLLCVPKTGLALPALVLLSACCRLAVSRRIRAVIQTCLCRCAAWLRGSLSRVVSVAVWVVRTLVGSALPYVGRLSIVVVCVLGAVITSIIVSLPSLLAIPFVQQHATTLIAAMRAQHIVSEAAQGNLWPATSQMLGWAASAAPTALLATAHVFAPAWLKAPLAIIAGQPALAAATASSSAAASFPLVTGAP